MGLSNPIAFRPFAVTLWICLIYIAVIIPLVVVHESVPPAPDSPTPRPGINLTQTWMNLDVLSGAYHPFNSHQNDEIHDWLLLELEGIQKANGAGKDDMLIFDDMVSNVTTAASSGSAPGTGTYFEGTNIMVYIRGKDDPEGPWWESGSTNSNKMIGKGGVLMNAHYDSVSTGFGATDDGVGVVSLLAMVSYFSLPEHQPQRGIVALFNNNEEDWLWGARAFGNSPLMPFCHTFLNLEGAGAGGRANLFRTTDAEVTSAYKGAENPFGTVISSDAFSLGAIRSGTDFSIFTEAYGIRGLDLAFYRPRARYHTNQDDSKHTSKASIWHMLSLGLHTMKNLSGKTGETFIGPRRDSDRSKVFNGKGTTGVWFDIFGQSFALFDLRSMFAWSLTLLVASPLILLGLSYILVRKDKYYFFSSKASAYEGSVSDPIMLGGRRGILRFPFALVVSAALVVGSAYLVRKINPLIVYSSEYTVWAMMISLFFFVFWTLMAGANFVRPSALHRGYCMFWLFTVFWVILVVNTVFEDRFNISSGYIFVVYQTAIFLSAFISLCELFALPTKSSYAQKVHDDHQIHDFNNGGESGEPGYDGANDEQADQQDHDDSATERGDDEEDDQPQPATETTPLMGDQTEGTTFARGYRRPQPAARDSEPVAPAPEGYKSPYGSEQMWSGKLPGSTWILQFLLLGPFIIILVGQSGLALVSSVAQTGSDGSSLLVPYLLIALVSILFVLPTTPFMHRMSHHIPLVLLIVFTATLVFNLVKFPFSSTDRYKVYFKQTVDLDTSSTTVQYAGIEEYVRQILDQIPSAMGRDLTCENSSSKAGLSTCSYDGSDVPPNVADTVPGGVPPQKNYSHWISYNTTRHKEETRARFEIDALETRSCAITFKTPISAFHVVGGGEVDERFGSAPESGLTKVALYRRDWMAPWKVDVEWSQDNGTTGLDGWVTCGWDDVNTPGKIPAYDEGIKFAPAWAALTKLQPGLLEGRKAFKV